jgi:hypothetical protein
MCLEQPQSSAPNPYQTIFVVTFLAFGLKASANAAMKQNTPTSVRHTLIIRLRVLFVAILLGIVCGARAQEYVAKDLYIVESPSGDFQAQQLGQVPIALGQTVETTSMLHALLFLSPQGEVVELEPGGFSGSLVNSTDGHEQVGALYIDSIRHAALWSGTQESAVDLNPTLLTGFDQSIAYGTARAQQVGSGVGPATDDPNEHALLWEGTAASAIDLHPAGFTTTFAQATDGQQQVGAGAIAGHFHALLWTGTADSAVDLGASGGGISFTDSVAYGVGGGQQVGYLQFGPLSEQRAALWNGTADSVVDLRPNDSKTAYAFATNGRIQVGQTQSLPPEFFIHARLWKGTADSAVDLHALLPAGFTNSTAYSIDAAGNIYGIAVDENGAKHAVEWLTQAASLANISTRAYVGTGDNVLIAGFIINGTQNKPLLIRGLGPSLGLPPNNVPNVLEDPTLELYDSAGTVIGSNDNWKDTQQAEIEATGIPPTEDAESAILDSLPPGAYTVILRGIDLTEGNGLVEFYDLDTGVDSRLANISSRGLVQTGDNVMIGGFIVGGGEDGSALVRAIGPSLAQFGVADALADPFLELYNSSGDLIAMNDNWRETQEEEISATGIPPSDDKESAILATLGPGNYTAIVRGAAGGTGVALIEAYQLPPPVTLN